MAETWCPGCSMNVAEPCHHFNCPLKREDELATLRAQLAAAEARNEIARKALEQIASNYANPDIGHQDYRVKAFQVADEALRSQFSGGG